MQLLDTVSFAGLRVSHWDDGVKLRPTFGDTPVGARILGESKPGFDVMRVEFIYPERAERDSVNHHEIGSSHEGAIVRSQVQATTIEVEAETGRIAAVVLTLRAPAPRTLPASSSAETSSEELPRVTLKLWVAFRNFIKLRAESSSFRERVNAQLVSDGLHGDDPELDASAPPPWLLESLRKLRAHRFEGGTN